jgi:hypothetical protein
MKLPFEATPEEIRTNPEEYISAVFGFLESEFLVLPKGEGFIDYPTFEAGYEALKQATKGFADFTEEFVLPVCLETPIAMIVLRSILGFTPPEWAYVASQQTGQEITQGAARTLDRKIRTSPHSRLRPGPLTLARVRSLVRTACKLATEGVPAANNDKLHRLHKADTMNGLAGLQCAAQIGVPYAMLLYERFLGRPFAGHRDSVSELVGGNLETLIEDILSGAGISFRKTKRAERIPSFDQAPDFIVPDEYAPKVVIEAKLTEDDGTARDKITRIQHLAALSLQGAAEGSPKFEVVACIGGRGFGVRREDMRKLLLATRGKVFTPKTLDRLVDSTTLRSFKTSSEAKYGL